jgi:hypothetical protein
MYNYLHLFESFNLLETLWQVNTANDICFLLMIYCVKKGWPSLKDLCLHGKFGRAKSFWRCATTNHVNSLATTERNKLKSLAWLPLHIVSFLEFDIGPLVGKAKPFTVFPHIVSTELQTPNEAFFHWNPELLGLGRQIRQINSGAFGVFWAELSAPILAQWVIFPCFSIIQPLFLQKTKPLYPHPNLFGIGV